MSYDYLIIGAGSAGCVLAHRLSANPNTRVLLLEAGPRDWNPLIHMPAGFSKLISRKGLNWDYSTEPEPQLDQRRLWWPRGKVLGGSSSINAMCYIRGHARDYDDWAALGAPGWDWQSVLPYFKRAEHNARGADAFHGDQGPLWVSDLRHHNPLSSVLLDAAVELGFERNADFNGARMEGFGFYQVTQQDGRRCSSAAAYLTAASERDNLVVHTHARVERVSIERGRAVAVEYRHRGERVRVEAAREILLAGGAVNSPQLLLLSGIGAGDELRRHGIEPKHDLPGVGRNLHDHLDACTIFRCLQPLSYDHANELWIGLQYAFSRKGPGSSNIAEAGGFVRSPLAPDERPDLQFHFVPAILDDHGRKRHPGHGMTLHACHLQPRSRGRIELASADPLTPPRIFANYLGDADGFDRRVLVEAVRLSRKLFQARAFDAHRGAEMFPGDGDDSEAAISAFLRRKSETVYHPVGSCRMGSDALAVVDPNLRVHGIEGLRVIDASVMPKIVSGNTNAPTIMIAERASDLILAG